jgi:hypothetical protein
MSTAEERNTETDTGADEPAEPKDPRKPLTNREVFQLFLRDLTIRPYVFAALGSVAMIFLVMFLSGSDIGAVVVLLFALATLVFRWIAGPPLLLLILFYFQLFPFGIPQLEFENPFEVRETYFRVSDVILIMAILVYMRCTYRIFGFIHQSMPFESVFRRKDDHPTRRPLSHIERSELAWMIGVTAALVIIGQLLWWLSNQLEFTPADDEFPIRWADNTSPARYRRRTLDPGEFTAGTNRFFIILGALFFGFLFIRLVFGYWRLRVMGAPEGAMVLTDTSWAESHRERVRVEKWRIWGRTKEKEQAKKEARAERERREKEAERERSRAREREREQERRSRRPSKREDDDERPRPRERDERENREKDNGDNGRPRRGRWE